MSESEGIQIPLEFVELAQRHLDITGQPLLEYSAPPYSQVVYACAWWPPRYELQTEPERQEPSVMTWRDYAEYYGIELPDLLEENGLEEEELENQVPDSLAVDGASPSSGARVYSMFEELWTSERDVVGSYQCAETGEFLGEVVIVDGPAPGNDYIGVSVDNPLVLSCLQFHLDRVKAGIRIELYSTDG